MNTHPRTAGIVAAAGLGKRMGTDKTLLSLRGKFLFLYAVEALLAHPGLDRVVVVTREDIVPQVEVALRQISTQKPLLPVVRGGSERHQSVWNALEFLKLEDPPELVLIQDGARPFLEERFITESLLAARESGAACVAIPAQDTLKLSANGLTIDRTLDRSVIWQAQTPQTFFYPLIYDAFLKLKQDADIERITDDSSVLERLGHQVRIVPGSSRNIKVTRPEDVRIAEAILDT